MTPYEGKSDLDRVGNFEAIDERGSDNFHTSIYEADYKGLLIARCNQNGRYPHQALAILNGLNGKQVSAELIAAQAATISRLERELAEARAEHQFSLGLVDQAAYKLTEARETVAILEGHLTAAIDDYNDAKQSLKRLVTAIEREPIVGDLDYPHAHNDWRGWRKKVLRPAAEQARSALKETEGRS